MLFCCISALALGCSLPSSLARPGGNSLPWHLADIVVDTGEDATFESVSTDLMILDDVPDKPQLFLCPVGSQMDGKDFYCGFLAMVNHARRQDFVDGMYIYEVARGSTFTRWGDMSPASVRPGQTGWYALSNHEGTIASVKHTHAWKKGWYTVRVARMDSDTADGKDYRWVGAFVTDRATGNTSYIGALRFVGREPKLDRLLSGFVEVYDSPSLPPPDPEKLPAVRVVYGNWRINNKPVTPNRVWAEFPDDVPPHATVQPAEKFWAASGEKPPKGAPIDNGAVAVTVGPKKVERPRKSEVLFVAGGK